MNTLTNSGMSMNDIAMVGRETNDRHDDQHKKICLIDDELMKFMSEGYLMGEECFGESSIQFADRLMEFVSDEYIDCICYLKLARMAKTPRSRKLFKSIAVNEMQHSKQFAAAYFLITGKRYFPTKKTIGPAEVPSLYIQALRQSYLKESRDAVKYHLFARQCNDNCLKRMTEAASLDEKRHAQNILELIQNI